MPQLYDHAGCYIFQNVDGRIVFVIPYETDFTLIGTTDQDFNGDPTGVRASVAEIEYLCRAASEYLRAKVTPEMVVWSFSGLRSLFDDGASAPQEATRHYVLTLDAPPGAPALLSVFGGKITTYRTLAEAALEKLRPFLAEATGEVAGWTGRTALPGGDFAVDGFEAQVSAACARYPFLPERTIRRLIRGYGTRVGAVLGDATSSGDLGRVLGADLTEAELRYLMRNEWARTAEDVVWRRSKLGLRLTSAEIAGLDDAMRRIGRDQMTA